jgi:hypothetical protein
MKLKTMKLKTTLLAFVLGAGLAGAQGTFVYDQQSTGNVDASMLLGRSPMGQSFTPTLDSINFVDLFLVDNDTSVSSTVAVNIRSGSITGAILGTSLPVTLPSLSVGTNDFLFSSSIALIPGTQYFLEPVVVSGGTFVLAELTFVQYAGGDAIYDGVAHSDRDFWFQEGVVSNVPEPSLAALLLIGSGVMYCRRRKWRVGKLCDGNG